MREYDYEFKTMGCEASVCIVASKKESADAAFHRMRLMADAYDRQFSRFLPESELSRLNTLRTLTVSPEFMEVCLLSRSLAERTGTLFNPLADISRFGYDSDIDEVRGQERALTRKDEPYDLCIERIGIDVATRTITLFPGQQLDFGGVLKGYAAERIAKSEPDFPGVIVNLGGDIFTTGTDAYGAPFSFSVDDPTGRDRDIEFYAGDEAIATSGTYARNWFLNGVPTAHILGTGGKPLHESDVVSSTVRAPSGAEADAFAKIPLIVGSREGARILASHKLAYCLVRTDGSLLMSEAFMRVPQQTTFAHV